MKKIIFVYHLKTNSDTAFGRILLENEKGLPLTFEEIKNAENRIEQFIKQEYDIPSANVVVLNCIEVREDEINE